MHRPTAALALCAGLLLALPAARADVSESFDRTIPLAADGFFEIENVNGFVHITAWDRPEVRIQAVKHAKDAEGLRDIVIDIESRSNAVEVDARLPKDKNARVDYEISLPRGAALDAELVNGPLDIAGIEGALDVAAVNGQVTVRGAKSSVDAETVNGDLSVGFSADARPDADLESVNGRLSIFLPPSVAGEFDAETVNGGIETDFPLEVRKARFGPMSSLEGRLGQGGGAFDLETVNGQIRILTTEHVEAKVVEYH